MSRRERPKKIKIKLADGKERTIQHMMATTFWSPDGKPISAAQFVEKLFGELPQFFKDEDELRRIWSRPDTRKALLQSLAEKGFGGEQLAEISRMINAEKSDVFDVLAYIAFALAPITRSERVEARRERHPRALRAPSFRRSWTSCSGNTSGRASRNSTRRSSAPSSRSNITASTMPRPSLAARRRSARLSSGSSAIFTNRPSPSSPPNPPPQGGGFVRRQAALPPSRPLHPSSATLFANHGGESRFRLRREKD